MANDSTGPKREWLLSERERVRAHKDELLAQQRRKYELEAELARTERALEMHTARRPLPLLDRVRVASPCSQAWADMTGDERTRHCAACDKKVYDISAMSRDAAEAFLRGAIGTGACVRLYRRADGTVLTAEDCPVGVKKKRRKQLFVAAAGAASVFAAGMAGMVATDRGACSLRPRIDGRHTTASAPEMGEMAEPPPMPLMGDMAMEPEPTSAPAPIRGGHR